MSVATDASARSFRVGDLPNGDIRGCRNCHGDDSGATRTPFGSDAQAHLAGSGPVQERHVDWAGLCNLDSDGDGWHNGYELGDPDCVWVGGAAAKSSAWNPGDPESHPPPVCGNGKLDAGEPCEGEMMAKPDCMAVEAGTGELACTNKCTYDYSDCSMPPQGFSSGGGESGTDEGGGCSTSGGGADASAAALALAAILTGLRAKHRAQRDQELRKPAPR
jgi:hypothetical protein